MTYFEHVVPKKVLFRDYGLVKTTGKVVLFKGYGEKTFYKQGSSQTLKKDDKRHYFVGDCFCGFTIFCD